MRAVIAALHLVAATLILLRAQATQHGSLMSCLAGIPALVTAGWALSVAPRSWPVPSLTIFLCGGCLTIVSFLYLGRYFAILPAVRGIVTAGPFSIIRHPAYLGELMMIVGCCVAAPKLTHLAPLVAAIPLLAIRILAEERVMSTNNAYVEYTDQVRARLIPYVW